MTMQKVGEVKLSRRDESILVIDRLLSAGWASILDMNIALNDYYIEHGYDKPVKPIVPTDRTSIDFYIKLMGEGHSFTNKIRSSYFYHMTKIWASVRGDRDLPFIEKRNAFIKTESVNVSNMDDYVLSEATKEYIRERTKNQDISIFTYIDGYSICNDLKFYNERLRVRSSNKIHNEMVEGVKYDIRDAVKFDITPEPDVIERKLLALRIKKIQAVLLQKTTDAIQERLTEIEKLKEQQPSGWVNRVANLYMNILYDGIGIIDKDEIESIMNQFHYHMLDNYSSDFFPSESITRIINYKDYCSFSDDEFTDSVAILADNIKQQEDYSYEDISNLYKLCFKALDASTSLDESQRKNNPLFEAVAYLICSIIYMFYLTAVCSALTLYVCGDIVDLNDIIGRISIALNYYIQLDKIGLHCDSINNVYRIKSTRFISSLNLSDVQDRFAKGIVDLSLSIIDRNIPSHIEDIIKSEDIEAGINLLDDQGKLVFRVLCSYVDYINFKKELKEREVNNKDNNDSKWFPVQYFFSLFDSLINGESFVTETFSRDKVLRDLEHMDTILSSRSNTKETTRHRMLINYAIIVLQNKPYPADHRGFVDSKTCEKEFKRVFDDAFSAGMKGKELLLLQLLVIMIILRNIQNQVYYEKCEYGIAANTSLFHKEAKKNISIFLPIAESVLRKMEDSETKRQLQKNIEIIKECGFFSGFIKDGPYDGDDPYSLFE